MRFRFLRSPRAPHPGAALAAATTAVLALLMLAAASSNAAAASFPRTYDLTVRSASVRQEWTELSRGWPKKCRPWIKGRGFVEQKAAAGGGTLTIDDNGLSVYGLSTTLLRGSLERVITYRGHPVPQTAECGPCDTEYGRCREERPDVIWHDTCGPKDGGFDLNLMLDGRRLYIGPGLDDNDDILDHCREVDTRYAEPGPSNLHVDSVNAPGAARALIGLRVGARKTVRFSSRRGSCQLIGEVGDHTCETVEATIVFRRTR